MSQTYYHIASDATTKRGSTAIHNIMLARVTLLVCACDSLSLLTFRSIVPKSAIQELNGLPPKPSTKTQHWNIAMLELKKYGENIEAMREKMGLSKSSDKLHKSFKSKESKLIVGRGESQQEAGQHNNHYDGQRAEHLNGSGANGPFSISNHIPPLAAVVEVNPSGADDDKLENNMALSEPSSPGSPRDLQIDLDQTRSPGKKKMGGSTNMLASRRNIPGSLDFDQSSSPQAVGSNLSQLSRRVKGGKAGDRLTAVLSNLTRRAAMGGQGGSMTPVSAGVPLSGGGGGGSGGGGGATTTMDNMDVEESEDPNGQGQSDNPFSSIYHDRNKTAIALVDPDSHKRKRNINKRFGEQQPPPAKKSKVQSSANSKTTSNKESGSAEPLLTTSGAPEITVNNTSLSFVNLRPEVPTAVVSSTSVSPQSSTESPSSKGGGKGHHHAHQQQQHQSQTSGSPGGAGFNIGVTPGRPTNATGKKKAKSKAKQAGHGRSPTKGVSKTSSTPNRALVTASSSSTAASAAVTSLSHPPPSQAAAAAPSSSGGQETLNNLRIGVRGEEAAPGMDDDDSNDFAEGSGLFADTVRKVNQSFRARVNHLTGNSDDMGYQYFTEKVGVGRVHIA